MQVGQQARRSVPRNHAVEMGRAIGCDVVTALMQRYQGQAADWLNLLSRAEWAQECPDFAGEQRLRHRMISAFALPSAERRVTWALHGYVQFALVAPAAVEATNRGLAALKAALHP
jgi:hypothetical protein